MKVRKAGGDQWGAMGSGGGLTGKRQRGHVGGAAQEAAQLVQCALGESGYEGMD